MSVREFPPLWHDVEVQTPGGRRYRWADDEPRAENVYRRLRHGSTMPGGFEQMGCALARDPAISYQDLERLSTLIVRSAGGEVVSETRLEGSPRTSGDSDSVSPSGQGWQAHLDDNKSASGIFIDRDLGRWGALSAQRRSSLGTGYGVQEHQVRPDPSSAIPTLVTGIKGSWSGNRPISEAWYDAGPGNTLGALYYGWSKNANVSAGDAGWFWRVRLATDDLPSSEDASGNLRAAGPGSGSLAASAPTRRFAYVQFFYDATAGGSDNTDHDIYWDSFAVIGTHGLTVRGTQPDLGLYDGDIVGYVIARWAPLLRTVDASGQSTITSSSFVIPHLAFYDPTTASAMIKEATRFGLRDWAIWENKTFWLHDRGARGRSWRARVAPAGLEEAGPQLDRLWESIIVAYRDVDGSTRTVGPPGSGADIESGELKDSDPDNPANLVGITRRDRLVMGTSTAAGAIEVGRRFLEETKLLDRSGRARLTGHVQDDHGILHPFSHVRAGDTISFVDAADTSPRRIVKAEHDHDALACSVDLDAPPEALQALLERLGAVLVPLGL